MPLLSQPEYTRRNRIRLVRNGQEFLATCCQMAEGAREKILFHTYSFKLDEVTQPFVDLLIAKAEQGVQVFMIIDAVGSRDISASLRQRFSHTDNLYFAYFAPLISRRLHNIGRRLHQKLLLVDNHQALIGGINHSAHFIKPVNGFPWLDYAALLEGEEVFRVQCKVRRLYEKYFPNQRELLNSLIDRHPQPPASCVPVRTTVNDFMRFKSEVYWSYIRAIRRARNSIYIFATYFLPGKRLLRELKKARRRGVRIELIFGAFSDHPTERWSSKYLYSWYLKHNITIYEWDKSVVHSKVALIDDVWVTLGSYNHNYLSRYINMELNVEVLDREFAKEIAREIRKSKEECMCIDRDSWRRNTTLLQSCLYFCTYMLANLVTMISTILVIRRKDRELNE